jgi:UMF1 family MFS transporter
VDGRIGSKRGILISVGGCLACMIVAISITPTSVLFMIPYDAQASGALWDFPYFRTLPEALYVANFIVLVVFIGAIFATSRAMMARIAPLTMLSQFFGLYAVSGWATAFIGHGLVALFTTTFHSQRAGFGSTIILLTVGWLLMLRVREERAPNIRLD